MGMECLNKYNPDHYQYYLEKANELIEKHRDIDSWVKSLTDKNILLWLNILRKIRNNDDAYFQEMAVFLTVLIRLFILELDVDNKLSLKKSEIKKIVTRFEVIIKREYAQRKDLIKGNSNKYTLLFDIKKG